MTPSETKSIQRARPPTTSIAKKQTNKKGRHSELRGQGRCSPKRRRLPSWSLRTNSFLFHSWLMEIMRSSLLWIFECCAEGRSTVHFQEVRLTLCNTIPYLSYPP